MGSKDLSFFPISISSNVFTVTVLSSGYNNYKENPREKKNFMVS